MKTLVIFRRDLRFEDNTALHEALSTASCVIPCFIINPDQVGAANPYRGDHALQFMIESLKELDEEFRKRGGKLYLFYGKPGLILEHLIQAESIAAVFVNKDYTPYSRTRDERLENICLKRNVVWKSYADTLLIEPEKGVSDSGKPYQIFTPFFKKQSGQIIAPPRKLITNGAADSRLARHPIVGEKERDFLDTLIDRPIKLYSAGGRSSALSLIETLSNLTSYEQTHNLPALDTSNLSPHNKFGTLSIREAYHAIANSLGKNHPLIRQLYWRDFFYHVAWFNPHVFGHAYNREYDHLTWSENVEHFKRWQDGVTGFPLVDAGMRQMNETGFMHNRVRMVVASFLIKDLHINWLWGEKYFAQKLEDYDPAVNNGNWQWVASTGCDHQPYFRIFNPWLQQKRFDPECIYIKRWIPELRSYDPKRIHQQSNGTGALGAYPAPMVQHAKESALSLALYKSISHRLKEHSE